MEAVPPATCRGGRGLSHHRAATWVPVFVIWGQLYLLVILLYLVHVIEFSSSIDFK